MNIEEATEELRKINEEILILLASYDRAEA
jgi:hypothetical protein